MRNLKRALGLTGLTGLLAALAGVVPAAALADPAATAACTVNGQATVNPAVAIGPNNGSYTFDSSGGAAAGLQLNCVVNVAGGSTGVATVTATSIGTYVNEECGTGSANSTSNDVTGVTVRQETGSGLGAYVTAQEDDLAYDITFIGTHGLLTFRDTEAGNASGDGPIKITDPTPQEINPITGVCTTDFEVSGALQGDVPAE